MQGCNNLDTWLLQPIIIIEVAMHSSIGSHITNIRLYKVTLAPIDSILLAEGIELCSRVWCEGTLNYIYNYVLSVGPLL